MMTQQKIRVVIILVAISLFLVSLALFRVQEWQQAAIFKFRQIHKSDIPPGLHVMIPGVNKAQKFERRLLNLDRDPQRFITEEKKAVIVDYYVKWRISDIAKFYESTKGGDINYANRLLEQRINRALRDEFGKRTVQEVVAGERTEILKLVTMTTAGLQKDLGLAVVDVRTKRIDLPEKVSESVYQRMRSERNRVAKELRAKGAEAAERIRADADREREIILANAYRDSEKLRGEGDAKATNIYANVYERDKEFYSLYRSLNAYQKSFEQGNDILILKPESDFFRYFNHRVSN